MDNLHLIQLGQYERPTITEERNRNYVSIGEDNNYYQSLIDAKAVDPMCMLCGVDANLAIPTQLVDSPGLFC